MPRIIQPLYQKSANYSPRTKSNPTPVVYKNGFIEHSQAHSVFSVAVFAPQWQSQVVVGRGCTVCKAYIFTIWLFAENVF